MFQIDTLPPYIAPVDTTADSLTVVCAYDTLFTPMGPTEPVLHRSLFTHHHLPVQNSHETTIQHQGSPGWLFVVIILSIIAPLMLMPISLVGYYAFFPQVSNIWTNILQYILLFAVCIAVYYTRNGIIRFIGNAFENSEAVHIYLSSNYIYHLLYGIAATAIAFFIFYTDRVGQTFLYILLAVIALLFTARLLRGMQLILTNAKTQKFYLFYYLCILEIVPLIIVSKVVINS